MGTIYLVRHGQAAYGTEDYDRLTDTGFAQARLLGQYFASRKVGFDAIYMGELRRHEETVQGIREGYSGILDLPSPERHAGLNEYRAEALVLALTGSVPGPDPIAARRDPSAVSQRFKVLKQALLAWTEGRIQPAGMPAWRPFQDAAVATLVQARQRFPKGDVLLVSSGGPISAAVAAALEAPAHTAVELNLRMRNSSVTQFATSARRHSLVCFNALPHLDAHPDTALATYA
jgi:broad specificity phosphatase PhoE